jgi:hypothetical protein
MTQLDTMQSAFLRALRARTPSSRKIVLPTGIVHDEQELAKVSNALEQLQQPMRSNNEK